ncbi:MAG: hypothetical protein ACFE9T_01890 [Promethearchaeota archaeon]
MKDALKFFQAYIKEMIDVGGPNLPKAIASKSGAKLGKLYKERGWAINIESALKQAYIALKAKPKITKINDNSYDIILKYSRKFCPIGGSYNPSNVSLFQDNICNPFTKGFLNEMFPKMNFNSEIKSCILSSNHRVCHYILHVEGKLNIN